MTDELVRHRLFELIKQALKAKGLTYAWLAKQLGVSEVSIKRLFIDKDCKTSRLLAICGSLDISLDDLLEMQKKVRTAPQYLPAEMEQALAEDPTLFALFIMLVSQMPLDSIREYISLDDSAFYLHLRRIEALGLIELLPENRFHFKVNLPIQWRLNGPLLKAIKNINFNYLGLCFDQQQEPDYAVYSISRQMTPTSMREIQHELHRLKEKFEYLAQQDQLFYKQSDLSLYKMLYASGPFPLQRLLPAAE